MLTSTVSWFAPRFKIPAKSAMEYYFLGILYEVKEKIYV
jgi:hypothetical protein